MKRSWIIIQRLCKNHLSIIKNTLPLSKTSDRLNCKLSKQPNRKQQLSYIISKNVHIVIQKVQICNLDKSGVSGSEIFIFSQFRRETMSLGRI